MYKYSPIKSIQIKNFRNLGDVCLDFNDSPIITLVGENESGKTSIVKAFGVCAMHQTPRSQKDFIRDGTTGFGIAITLEDGTLVTRMKTATSNVYRVQNPDGTFWEAKKLESTVPKAVSDVMGLIEEPETKELLQIRTYEDQLLFVVTPASTNYKVMYDSLKISQLTRAIKVGSTEANELKSKINSTESSITAFQNSLSSIRLYDLEPMLNIRNKLKNDMGVMDKLDSALSLKNTIVSSKNQLGAISQLNDPSIQLIDEVVVTAMIDTDRLMDTINLYKQKMGSLTTLANAEDIDLSLLEKVTDASNRLEQLGKMKTEQSSLLRLGDLSPISEVEIAAFDRIQSIQTQTNTQRKMLASMDLSNTNEISTELLSSLEKMQTAINSREYISQGKTYVEQYNAYIDQVITWMKQVGVATTDCPRCGEAVIIDLEQINQV